MRIVRLKGMGGSQVLQSGLEVVVRSAESGREYADFIELPYLLHRDNPFWVPPLRSQQLEALDPRRHPFYRRARRRLFVAYHDRRPVGRIAAIHNPAHCETFGEACTHFGFFESVDDDRVATALFAAVEEAALTWGHDMIRGPFSPNVNGELGLQIDAFDKPGFVMVPYHPPYYRGLVERQGFQKDVDLFCYLIHRDKAPDWLLESGQRLIDGSPCTFRKLPKPDLWKEAVRVWDVYSRAWQENWLWTKSTREEFMHLVKELAQIVDYDLVYLAENAAGELIGFSIALPNINEATIRIRDGRLFPFGFLKLLWHSRPRAIKSVRFIAMGVLEEYRAQNVHWGLIYLQIMEVLRKGYTHAEMSQILESNTQMIQVAERAGGTRYKTHRMFVKRLLA